MTDAPTTQQHLPRLQNRLTELRAWRDVAAFPLDLTFCWSGGQQRLREGEPWPTRELPVTQSGVVNIPPGWQGQPDGGR
ncbi:hypothetical protein [Deinococcus arenicola]|uniref:Uncharacterized protein n=1 Tax=Deinococcus arenicola TaxID=2994950 RepID=A0ABU4DSN1_9DEIO|nr:hypothetical protein [Deinococcus sp. ZS9-10]MDV6375438.1 hypothetical protein [Deinococcus sp. ZS9-10]